ncbi:MAG TPA: PAS domain-containing sensor histidine kinase [Thermoanaerobaculia bacterium]|nr:PAS domain-containing sensor histidine kinase [Thermoanaerobaculia bacterium]
MTASARSPAGPAPAADAVLILDARQRIVYATEAAAALLGRTPEELLHEPVSAFLDTLPNLDTWEAGGLQFTTVFLGTQDSARRVAAAMAHEFNNILAGIGTFAEYVQRRSTDESTRNAAERIGQAIRRGKSVTGEILRYARTRPPSLVPVDVRLWLEGFLPEANALTAGRVVLEIEGRLCIRADVLQLNQVLVNLLTNARDASPSGTPIVLRSATATRNGAEMLDLAVIDHGTGITPEVCERMFEPLVSTRRASIGLGLPVVLQIVRAHGGVVRVRTEVGKGSEFHVLVPLHHAA